MPCGSAKNGGDENEHRQRLAFAAQFLADNGTEPPSEIVLISTLNTTLGIVASMQATSVAFKCDLRRRTDEVAASTERLPRRCLLAEACATLPRTTLRSVPIDEYL